MRHSRPDPAAKAGPPREEECGATPLPGTPDAPRQDSLGTLAGGIAHDFNNLLTGMLGHAALARQHAQAGTPLHAHLEEVEKLCLRAADLCRQMLAYAGRTHLVFSPLDLNRLLQDSLRILRLSLPRHVALEFLPRSTLPEIHADAVPVWQAILSLVVNAGEACGAKGGQVAIMTGTAILDEAFLKVHAPLRAVAAGEFVYVEVRDSGCGMTEDIRARMFEPFFSTKSTGRGMGLSAVQGTVHGHGGVITVSTAPGHGTTVRSLFPQHLDGAQG